MTDEPPHPPPADLLARWPLPAAPALAAELGGDLGEVRLQAVHGAGEFSGGRAGLELRGEIRRNIQAMVAGRLRIGDVRRDRLLAQHRGIKEFLSQLVSVAVEDRIYHGRHQKAKQVPATLD